MTEPRRKRNWRLLNWTCVERARVLIEIAALLTAGIWALFTFVIGENRTYQKGGALASTLEWRKTPDGDCLGEYTVTFHNVSKIPVTIRAGIVRVWTMKKFTPNNPNETVRYVKPMQLRQHQLKQEETDRFNGTYQPDESNEEGFTFGVKELKPEPILFELILWDDDGLKGLKNAKMDVLTVPDENYPPWNNNRWDWPCFEKPKESALKSDHPGL
jgi:hypothetical protein